MDLGLARCEVTRGTDIELVRDLMLGSAQNLIIFRHEHYSDEKLKQIVDLILLGAAHGGRAPRARSTPSKRARSSVVTGRSKIVRARACYELDLSRAYVTPLRDTPPLVYLRAKSSW